MAVNKPKKAKAEKEEKKPKPAKAEKRQLRIKLVRSLIGRPHSQREVIKGLGLRRLNSEVIRTDCPEIWGMIKKVPHLVKVVPGEKK